MPTPADQDLQHFKGDQLSVKMLGLMGDARELSDFAITSAGHDLTSASNPFAAADVGKVVSIAGAGTSGGWLTTTIATFVNAGHVTTTSAAGSTVTAAGGIFGTDNATLLANIVSICRDTNRRKLYFTSGWYLTTATWNIEGGSVEIVGESKDNSASSAICYVGTGVGVHVYPQSPAAQCYAVNCRHMAFLTYGGCTDAVKIEKLSQGEWDDYSINDSTIATAITALHLIDPDILRFHRSVITRSTFACVTIESSGSGFNATHVQFIGGNLYQNDRIFNLAANLVHFTVSGCHIEQFTHLFYLDRAVGASDNQVNGILFFDNEVLGNTGGYTSDLWYSTVGGIDTLVCYNVAYRNNWFFFGTNRKNPFQINVGSTAAFVMDLTLRDNLFSLIDTSLVLAVLNPAYSIFELYAENNRKRFGSDFALQDSTNTGVTQHTPVYGGDKLPDTFRIPFVDVAGHLITDRGTSDSGLQYYPTTQSSSSLKGKLLAQSDCTDGQIELANVPYGKVLRIKVPSVSDVSGNAFITFAGSIDGIEVSGNLTIGNVLKIAGVSASRPLKVDAYNDVTSSKIDGTVLNDFSLGTIPSGNVLIAASSGVIADGGGPPVTFGGGVADGDVVKKSGSTLVTASQADICALAGFSVAHTHQYVGPGSHSHGGVTSGSGGTASASGSTSGMVSSGPS